MSREIRRIIPICKPVTVQCGELFYLGIDLLSRRVAPLGAYHRISLKVEIDGEYRHANHLGFGQVGFYFREDLRVVFEYLRFWYKSVYIVDPYHEDYARRIDIKERKLQSF